MKIQVLDHGSVEFIEAWGTGLAGIRTEVERGPSANFVERKDDYEVGIIEAARQSTQGSFRGWKGAACDCGAIPANCAIPEHTEDCATKANPGDARLLAYLYNNQHNTPFEFAGMTLEIEAPIFVFREWHRHRTQSYNEKSARYAPLPDRNYVPTVARLTQPGGANKQAQSLGTILKDDYAEVFQAALIDSYNQAEVLYQGALASGVPKELARLVLPVGRYSGMRASANLRNWLAFLTLRDDPRAQWEIRQYAQAVSKIIAEKFPQTHRLWVQGVSR